MSLAPDHDLLKAAIAALKADPVLVSLVGDRIYDRVPEKAAGEPSVPYPFIAVGPTSIAPADVECIDGVEVTIQFNVSSSGENQAYSSADLRTIIEAIRRTLHDAELTLEDNGLATLTYEISRIGREAGVLNVGIIQFTAVVETP